MILAVASGKGGTGKTTVSVNLAKVLDTGVQLLDCDVEGPNAHLFLKGTRTGEEIVTFPPVATLGCNPPAPSSVMAQCARWLSSPKSYLPCRKTAVFGSSSGYSLNRTRFAVRHDDAPHPATALSP